MTTSLLQPPLRLDEYRASAPPISTGLHQRAHSFAGHAHRLLSPPPQPVTTRPSFTPFLPPPQNQSGVAHRNTSLQLPGLAALASIASDQVQPSPHLTYSRSSSMSYATAAPGQSPGGMLPAGPPICQNCQTSTTPLWRRDESGSVLCNACGLFLKLHGRARPISLKTDVIKSRNRVKAVGPNGQKKRPNNIPAQGLAAAHPDIASVPQAAQAPLRRASQQHEPLSRAGTPSQYPPHPTNANIAPQHMFDNSTLDSQVNNSYSQSPILNNRPQSPSSLANGGPYDSSSQQLPGYDFLVSQNNRLKTRVSELEVINDLFQGRVSELEAALAQLQGTAAAPEDAASSSTPLESKKREAEDAAVSDEHRTTAAAAVAAAAATADTAETWETGSIGGDGNGTVRRNKRMRMSDLLEEDARASTPASTGSNAGAPAPAPAAPTPVAAAVGGQLEKPVAPAPATAASE